MGDSNKKLSKSNRGYYSDIVSTENSRKLVAESRPKMSENLCWRSGFKEYVPDAKNFKVPGNFTDLSKFKQNTTVLDKETDFPCESYLPKVQIPFVTPPGVLPRKLEIERKRRKFLSQNIEDLILTRNIKTEHLLHKSNDGIDFSSTQYSQFGDPSKNPSYLPLQLFDDEAFDCRTPQDWINMGLVNNISHPVPAKALLNDSNVPTWKEVGVIDYDEEYHLYLVVEINSENRVVDLSNNKILDGGFDDGGNRLELPYMHWLPRIYICFKAEDPENFANRIQSAYLSRRKTEALIRYEVYVECVPIEDDDDLNPRWFENICKYIDFQRDLKHNIHKSSEWLEELKVHVNVDYKKAMNRIVFDKLVAQNPTKFSFVTLPEGKTTPVPNKGFESDFGQYDYSAQKDVFVFNSLLTTGEGISAISKLRMECNKVVNMCLFQVYSPKWNRLKEFEQIQSHVTQQVVMYLKDSWMTALKVAVKNSMLNIRMGWFNIHQKNWEIYRMSKLQKFMEMIRFIMQDSMRFLIINSLTAFVNMIADANYSVEDIDDQFVWKESLLTSPFKPKKNPLFYFELQISEDKVHYGIKPDEVLETLIDLFDRAIELNQNIPQLEKYILENMFWAGTPLLESVGINEPKVVELRNRLTYLITKSLIPLISYSKCYNKYIELANVDIPSMVEKYSREQKTAVEIRNNIETLIEYRKQIEQEIPNSVVIACYYINTENIKMSLLRKQRNIINSHLNYMSKMLKNNMETATLEFREISRRLYETPNTIEELADKEEWMKTIPNFMSNMQSSVDKAFNDYQYLDDFYHNLSDDDFSTRWSGLMWPSMIEKQAEQVEQQITENKERFRKLQISDVTSFLEKIDSLQMSVAAIMGYSDLSKSHEVANEVRRVFRQLTDAKELSVKYQNRENLFDMPRTNFDKLHQIIKSFEPFRVLWISASDWVRWNDSCMNDPLSLVDSEYAEKIAIDTFKTMHRSVKALQEFHHAANMATDIKNAVEDFKPNIPLIQALRNPGMSERHWEKLSEELGFPLRLNKELTFKKCIEMKLQDHIEKISKIAEVAGKEHAIENALDKMESDWNSVEYEILPYKNTGNFIIKIGEEVGQMLDDHIVMTQSMTFSPYKKPFESRIEKWELTLKLTQDVLEECINCQRQWLYLQPIFSSDDINEQLPVEGKRFQTMERMWLKIMKHAKESKNLMEFCPDHRLLENIKECNKLLEHVQKGLSEYLEGKRRLFPRFYFLSDDELLEILSQTKDPTAVQPHLKKCFENISKLTFDDGRIKAMHSIDGEVVEWSKDMIPEGNVEYWLSEVEDKMRLNLREIFALALSKYPKMERSAWVLRWPGQIVIAGCQTIWTSEVTEALEKGKLRELLTKFLSQLDDLRDLVKRDLTTNERQTMSALIVIEVHARDVISNMIDEGVENSNGFEWISQLRYYWEEDDLLIRAVNAKFPYCWEYLGNSSRLVITPLTDRCYLTLTGALNLKFGGAPAGPAGTGKTETTKDLAKAMAIQCVVFNCSDQLDFMAMGKFFKGLSSSGAWACFDEFNRIDIEVLSVIAQQITTIQRALILGVELFLFEGTEISLKPSFAVFITMNPGYAGRTELPDNLKALFRPVSMMVPDYALIAEISLFSFGFVKAKTLANKIVTTFKLSSEQLSTQDHYDFGMRAVKTVISAAGNIKRLNFDMDEELIVLRGIKDVNVPKFLSDDLKLFNGIISDLFPKIEEKEINYGILKTALHECCIKLSLDPTEEFIHKCIQLYETTVVRHGLMLVGHTCSGKTRCYQILAMAQTMLKGQISQAGIPFKKTLTHVLNPKSITMGQLYGEFNIYTHEWTDGILSTLVRRGVNSTEDDFHWFMFDGPVDAIWIENMNTVLDDNKKLCLSSGEIIKLTPNMTMMFEVQDLVVASPATVSRCGMVYFDTDLLKIDSLISCWLNELPQFMGTYAERIRGLIEKIFKPSLSWMRSNVTEYVKTTNGNIIFSFLKIMDSFFNKFLNDMDIRNIPGRRLARVEEILPFWITFSVIWTVGATSDQKSRDKFDIWLRDTCSNESISFPDENLVYDYKIYDADICSSVDDEIYFEDIVPDKKICWISWLHDQRPFSILPNMKFSDITVPTVDYIRSSYVLDLLLKNGNPVLCVGPTGTSKTVTITEKLTKGLPNKYLSEFIIFSARTTANQVQDMIDGKLEKRRRGIFGPPLGKKLIFFIDDLNMPAPEVYGAQTPIELIRQCFGSQGWYDRKMIGEFCKLIDVNFCCAMGPPGGGRNMITQRLMRYFNLISFIEMSDDGIKKIFGTIIHSWADEHKPISSFVDNIVIACIEIYKDILSHLLPTPNKIHYTFNMRDLSRVFQGILMHDARELAGQKQLLSLWYHECCRVFQDRLVDDSDREWFHNMAVEKMEKHLMMKYEQVVDDDILLYADFMSEGVDVKPYRKLENQEKVTKAIDEYINDYNQINTSRLDLVMFTDAIKHLCRISRVIRQPYGNALLLGVGGSGRQSLTKLATHLSDYTCFQIELTKNYGLNEWKEDLKSVMMQAGLKETQIVFLFSDSQIKDEGFLESLNNILNSGDVPNIYGNEELEKIYEQMQPICTEIGMQPTKTNLYSIYTKRVRTNLHTVITMSPLGDSFRARLRRFPALVSCCTIDWFSRWPKDALESVANRFLRDLPELDNSEAIISGIIRSCCLIHQNVIDLSNKFLIEMSRHNYVTPTSYLELLSAFSSLLGFKRQEIVSAKNRLKTGLDKLMTTSEEVVVLQKDLNEIRPQLEVAIVESNETLKQIEMDTKIAEETRATVKKEEVEACAKAEECQNIADDAQRDLSEALPILSAALSSLKSLNKNDVFEVKAMSRPPDGVKLVMETVCIMKGIKPKKVPTEVPGVKVDDYWEPGKTLLQEPQKFLDSLFNYDKENIPEDIIRKIRPYIDQDNFTPEAISKVSKACTSICQWVRAMYKYHFAAKVVEPKREKLRIAQKELAETQEALEKSQRKLDEIEEGITQLEDRYDECSNKKKELEEKCELCEGRLERAGKLIGGLGSEKTRWQETVETLEYKLQNFVGDILIAATSIAYLGPFTHEYRSLLFEKCLTILNDHEVPTTTHPEIVSSMGDPVNIRNWQISGLPKDNFSVENAIISKNSKCWPLFIDPQGQANKWIKNLEKDNNIEVIKLSEKDFLRTLENSIRFGKPCLLENVGEELDPVLNSLLLRQTFKQSGTLVIKIGDTIIPYHSDFRFYITTKLSNPHYTPEVSVKVVLINFTLSPRGLEDQLLGIVVAEERSDLEDAKNQLIVNNARMRGELKELEDKILVRLSVSEGNPVDDIDLIKMLAASKVKSEEIRAKVEKSELTEKYIDETRGKYMPVAINTQILFFCVADLAKIDPMYQYSLEWFVNIFLNSINNAKNSDDLNERIKNINDHFTYNLYTNVCRSLFERHKLLFAFLLSARIKQNFGEINPNEWRYLLLGSMEKVDVENPAKDWLSDRNWKEIVGLQTLDSLKWIFNHFTKNPGEYKRIFDSSEPQNEPLPRGENLNDFQKIILLKCLRADKITPCMQQYVVKNLGVKFIEPQTTNLGVVFKESSPFIPFVFIISAGTDPAADLYKFAEEMRFSKKLLSISLGQGQGPRAEAMMREAVERGKWIFFQNCHLAPSWMPQLERLIEKLDPEKVHKDFRLWLTSLPSNRFPTFILQNSSKMTVEPPRGIKANLLRSYAAQTDEFLCSCEEKTPSFKSLLFSLCLFHGVTLERRKFGPLGFNIPYEFTDGDLRICISQLKMFLMENREVPFKVLKYTAGEINYGGRVTDDWDRRTVANLLSDFYSPDVLREYHPFSPSKIFFQPHPSTDHRGYMDYIKDLPLNDTPEIFGLHENADITFAQNETTRILNCLVTLQPRSSSGDGDSSENIVDKTTKDILKILPNVFNVAEIAKKYPVLYEESMNTVLMQEAIRYNRLLSIIRQSLEDLLKAIKGLVVMSQELEDMAESLYNNKVPQMWEKYGYPSLKPLASWMTDLVDRTKFIYDWITFGIPRVFWISGFFFPQAFLTGTLQNFARKNVISIDKISFSFKIMKGEEIRPPESGCYINGLFIEGARWDKETQYLSESKPKELYSNMPLIWLIPTENKKHDDSLYVCPVYKTLTRAGTLSTTGHSTNFVFSIDLTIKENPNYWIKRGVAMICALNY